jgi:hypothetical protein
LIDSMSGTWPEAFETINSVRNGVMHGESTEEIEARLSMPFKDVVDRTGILAWNAILRSITYTPGPPRQLNLAAATTFFRRILTMKAKLIMGSFGDPNNPMLENMPAPTITVQSAPRRPPDAPTGG